VGNLTALIVARIRGGALNDGFWYRPAHAFVNTSDRGATEMAMLSRIAVRETISTRILDACSAGAVFEPMDSLAEYRLR
jgi:hypothetical protein